jgi:hypothetical protein
MNTRNGLYCDQAAIAPSKPIELSAELRESALEIVVAAAWLGRALHPVTTQAIADFLHLANSYYSNLIEGHDTHPLAIAQVLRTEYTPFSRDIWKRWRISKYISSCRRY